MICTKCDVKTEDGKLTLEKELSLADICTKVDELPAILSEKVIENYAEPGGKLKVPEVLKPYLDNKEYI